MFNRWIEKDGLKDYAYESGIGLAVFSPLSQGLLTDKYLQTGSGTSARPWMKNRPDDETLSKIEALNEVAAERGQKLSQMAISWILRNDKITTVLIGASRPEQIVENAEAAKKTNFTEDELNRIEDILR